MRRRAISLVLALALFVPALVTNAQTEKKSSDADIAKRLVGKWRLEPGEKGPPIKVTMTFAGDQKWSVEAESLQVAYKVKGTGTWKVEKGEIVATLKESTNPKEAGKVERTKVIALDDSTLKVRGTVTPNPRAPTNEVKELVLVFKKVK
jgi:hypothetical protein